MMSVVGPSRHFAATRQFSRFQSKADIQRFSVCTDPVAFDPEIGGVVRRPAINEHRILISDYSGRPALLSELFGHARH
jgi:hypothetical protein